MLIWYAAGVVAAVGVGWFAAVLNGAGWAPVLILPIGVGVALGAILAALARRTGITCRKRLILGTTMLALVAVFSEHAWLYRDFCQQWREARVKDPRVAVFRPESPWLPSEYFTHELNAGSGPMWCLDGVLIVGATLVTVFILQRHREVIGVAADAESLNPEP
jgi:hypothetical protein